VVTPRSSRVTAAGILNIIGGSLNALAGMFIVLAGLVIGTVDNAADADLFRIFMVSVGVLITAFGVVGIVSAVYIWRKQYRGLALAGAILTFLAGCLWIVPAVIGIAAIVLVSISKNEFS
jgi:hypothetical protein